MARLGLSVGLGALVLASLTQAATPALSAADKAAAFAAAGFKLKGGRQVRCEDDAAASYSPGVLEAADLNGDGAPEAWITEDSTYCYGNTGTAVVLVTKRAGGWSVLLDEVGVASALPARHAGWPDIEVGGPGMGPFPAFRFDGTKYALPRR